MTRVLVVDDQPENRFLLEAMLHAGGYDVVCAAHGAEALELARRRPPDLLITDILMPVMDGFVLCRQWKRDPVLCRIPFVFYTATYTHPRDQAFAMGLGADAFIVKPVAPDAFLPMIRDILERHRAGRLSAGPVPAAEDRDFSGAHEAAVVRKLEDKLVELTAAHAALARREAFAQAILNSLTAHIAVLDRSGTILAVNEAWSRFAAATPGTSPLQVGVGVNYLEVCRRASQPDAQEAQAALAGIERILADPQSAPFEMEYPCHSPEEHRWFLMRVSPLRSDEGGAVVSHIDITARRLAEEDRAHLEDQLRHAQRMETVVTLAGGLAHDFNNLLAVIFGGLELARDALGPGHAAENHLAAIEQAARQAAGITRSMLTFSRKSTIERRRIDLADVLRETEVMVRGLLPPSIRAVWEVPAGAMPLLGDAVQLRQVLVNLVLNARDAMPDGGELRVWAEPGECGESMGGSRPPQWRLIVADNGTGMAPEVRERIFEPFFTTRPRGQGTGLGLSIAHGIVADHGGRIEVESEPGRGTRVRVQLPALGSSPPDQRKSPADFAVLLVEDNELVASVLATGLHAAGLPARWACCGREALRLAETEGSGLQVVAAATDLPDMTGPECLARIAALLPSVRGLLMAPGAEAADALPEAQRRRWPVLIKPLRVAELCREVQALLPTSRAGAG